MNKILKARIVEKYGSQIEFAKAIREHEAVISRVIHGHNNLTAKERLKWARALDCNDSKKIFLNQEK